MAIKSTSQITITDVTDAYSVILSSEAFTIAGGTSGATSGSCKTNVIAMQGASSVTPTVNASDITFQTASGSASDVLTATVDSTTNPTTPEITFSIASGKTLSETIEAVIPVKLANNTITVTKKFSFGVAKTGQTGQQGPQGNPGANGTSITGVASKFKLNNSTTAPTIDSSWSDTPSAPTSSNKYLWSYEIITYSDSTTSNTAAHIVGTYGATGSAGATWYTGTAITGTSTTPTSYATGISAAKVNDQYVNTDTGNVYLCTTAGNASTAKWKYSYNIKGATGDAGDDAVLVSITTDNGDCFKNSSGNTTLTPEVYVGGTSVTIGAASTAGKFPVTINGTQCYLYWYRGDTKLDSTNTGSASGKYGEFVSSAPYGRLKVYASQVSTKQPYTCKIEDS